MGSERVDALRTNKPVAANGARRLAADAGDGERVALKAPAPGLVTTSQYRPIHPQGVQFKPVLLSNLIPVVSYVLGMCR